MNIKANTGFYLVLILAIFFVVFFVLSVPYFSGDVKNHKIWGRSILEDGPKGFYGRVFHDYSFPNYPPVSMLSFAGSVWLFDRTRDLIMQLDRIPFFPSLFVKWINFENVEISFLKIPAILPFVFSGGVIFYFGKIFKKNFKESIRYTLFFLLNPAFIYLSVVWGQNDFSQVLFILLAILFLFKERFSPAAFFAGLSILSKQTVLMIWGLFLLTTARVFGIRKAIIGFLVSVIMLWFFYLPFNEGSAIWPFTFYNETLRSTGFLVADNAINYWGLLSRFRPSDSQEIIFLKLEYWGFIFFGVLFLPVIYKFFKTKFSKELFIYFLFMSSIIYFFSLTRMHERYLIFGVVFAHLLTMVNKKYWFNLVFFSSLLLLNMYKGLLMPDIPELVSLLKSVTVLSILGTGYLLILVSNYYFFIFKLKNEKD